MRTDLFAFFGVLIFYSCSPSLEHNQINIPGSRIMSMTVQDRFGEDMTYFTYDEDRLVQLGDDGRVTYKDEQLDTVYYPNGGQFLVFFYNEERLDSIHLGFDTDGIPEYYYTKRLNYDSQGILESADYLVTPDWKLTETYKWENGNIIEVAYVSTGRREGRALYAFGYDSKPNFWNQNPRRAFFDFDYLNANNITSQIRIIHDDNMVARYPKGSISYKYTYNQEGFPLHVKPTNGPIISIEYF